MNRHQTLDYLSAMLEDQGLADSDHRGSGATIALAANLDADGEVYVYVTLDTECDLCVMACDYAGASDLEQHCETIEDARDLLLARMRERGQEPIQ